MRRRWFIRGFSTAVALYALLGALKALGTPGWDA